MRLSSWTRPRRDRREQLYRVKVFMHKNAVLGDFSIKK
jgi:hypothetical protein